MLLVIHRPQQGLPPLMGYVPNEFRRRTNKKGSGGWAASSRRAAPPGGGMSEAALAAPGGTPDSDCNSNPRPASSASLLSNASDADFHDNSDYQWFLDYGYRDAVCMGSTHATQHHPSILSLGGAYDALAADLDANLAEADMDTFRTADIHALLTHLPPMCSESLPQELQGGRQGESYAELSASLLSRLGLEGSLSPASGSQADLSASAATASICKSEPLFSPVREAAPPPPSFSVDSLDCDMMLTCQANKDNYTIAFEGSLTADSDDSEYMRETGEKNNATLHHATSLNYPKYKEKPKLTTSMTQSDSSSLTTWSKLKKRCSDDQLRRPSGNNNNSEDEGNVDSVLKSASLPNLYKQRLRNLLALNSGPNKSNSNSSSGDTCTVKRRSVKVFDIQHQLPTSSGSEMATSADASSSENQPKLNLVKLFMRQKSMSAEGMSTTLDQLSSSYESGESNCSNESNEVNKVSDRTYDLIAEENEEEISRSPSVEPLSESISVENSFEKTSRNMNNNNSFQKTREKLHRLKSEVLDRSIQTSQFSEILNLKNAATKNNGSIRESIKLIEPSFLSKLKKEGEMQKPVYVLYPNYVLPDLNFLKEKQDISKLLFVPQKAPVVTQQKRRPFSFNDIEMLKKKGFRHVKDWESLNFLLPQEYKKILSELPEISEHIKIQKDKQSFGLNLKRMRPLSCDLNQTNVSSSSSTATQPSSGYRGSSTILTDSQNSPAPQTNHNPLFVYKYDSVTSSEASLMNSERQKSITTTAPQVPLRCYGENIPPRPPLPKGILRRNLERVDPSKRYSMYETSEEEMAEEVTFKRKSVPEPYYLQRNKRMSETEDEGIDFGTSESSLDETQENIEHKPEHLLGNISVDELVQLEEFLKMSGLSSDEEKATEESLTHLRSYVSKFLNLKINQEGGLHFGGKKSVSFAEKANLLQAKHFIPPNNSPNVSAFLHQKNYQPKNVVDLTICEEGEHSPNYRSPQTTPVHLLKTPTDTLTQKRSLITAVTDSVEQIVQHFSPASDQQELNALGDSSINPAGARLCLTTLCPALYALLSDGLKPSIETSFGDITNGVWQVVEATARQGPLTRALQDLVARVNAEDAITEGLVKFNAFVFGLLNVRSLDAWASFLRTRESVLKRHYTADSILLLSHTGGSDIRAMLDAMVASLQPLAFLPFQLDLMFEYRQLHQSFKRMDSYAQPLSPIHRNSPVEEMNEVLNTSKCVRKIKERPRSCVDSVSTNKANFRLGEDVSNVAKKRWSGIAPNSKLYQVYDRLAREDEEYVDSLESPTSAPPPEEPKPVSERDLESLDSNPSDEKPLNGRRFRKLQQKWEMLSNGESSEAATPTQPIKSRIPRPITSPVRPSGIPVPVSPTCKKVVTSPGSGGSIKGPNSVKSSPVRKAAATQRTSRVDQVDTDTPRHVTRPSSLPYKPSQQNKGSKITPPRRAASSSLNRRVATASNARSDAPKFVRTITQRVPSESGHLPFTRGEKLKVALVVDERWLVCARRGRQGLVPRSAVVPDRDDAT